MPLEPGLRRGNNVTGGVWLARAASGAGGAAAPPVACGGAATALASLALGDETARIRSRAGTPVGPSAGPASTAAGR
ncbi:hypothetical protein MYSI104531_16835 [Mycobacterium simiae]